MEVYLYTERRSVSAIPPIRNQKMDTEYRSVSAVPPVCTFCTRKMDTERRSVSAVPPVWTRKMDDKLEVDSVIRFLQNRGANTVQVGGS